MCTVQYFWLNGNVELFTDECAQYLRSIYFSVFAYSCQVQFCTSTKCRTDVWHGVCVCVLLKHDLQIIIYAKVINVPVCYLQQRGDCGLPDVKSPDRYDNVVGRGRGWGGCEDLTPTQSAILCLNLYFICISKLCLKVRCPKSFNCKPNLPRIRI